MWVRWLHIYVSMAAFMATLLFAVTGLTLNHAAWFESGSPSVRSLQGELPKAMLQGEVDKLAVAEQLRAAHSLRGMVTEFVVEDDSCTVIWKGPGYSADVAVQRQDGRYDGEEQRRGFVAVIDDLHKGRDCGPVWSWVVDVSAAVLALVAATGIWLLFYLKKYRRSGLVLGLCGGVALVVAFAFGVA